MNTTTLRTGTIALVLAVLPLAGACSRHDNDAAAQAAVDAKPAETHTAIGKVVAREIEKARVELRKGNIGIGGNGVDVDINGHHYGRKGGHDDRPRAEISPAGDLLVDGKTVAVTPAQRALLLEYRGEVLDIAEAGMTIGAKGADIAGDAIGGAIGAIFSGDTKEMEQRVEAKAEKLKQDAKVLCGRLPAMMATQQKLAASLPAFKPYATMTQEDIDDCADDIDDKGVWSK
ncbi:MAG TPA: hypothetical protein VFT52_06145 [Luteimonas sp.]|jgi:hypothetical protein|nr:hypothetical protein [Luteimonas sp.]